jgi:hypothetical protein
MPTSLLSVVQDASDELGLPHPSAVLSNSDLTVVQLAALTRAAGDTLVKRRLWRFLVELHSITTTTAEYYALPSDYSRIIDNTTWDGTNHWPLDGPLLSQEWQYLTRGIVSSGPRMQFRFSENRIQVRPTPVTAGLSLSFFYISKYWIYVDGLLPTDDVTRQAAFQLDSDLIAFDHRLIVDSVKLRFLQAKGFDTTAVAQDLQNSLDDAVSADTGAMKLNLARGSLYYPLVGVQNIPDGSWP